MNCFECGWSICLTQYRIQHVNGNGSWVEVALDNDRITHVRKSCINCNWTSHPTIIPEAIE